MNTLRSIKPVFLHFDFKLLLRNIHSLVVECGFSLQGACTTDDNELQQYETHNPTKAAKII